MSFLRAFLTNSTKLSASPALFLLDMVTEEVHDMNKTANARTATQRAIAGLTSLALVAGGLTVIPHAALLMNSGKNEARVPFRQTRAPTNLVMLSKSVVPGLPSVFTVTPANS